MKKILLLCVCCVSMASIFAQEIPRQSIKDSVLGWMKVYNFKGAKAGIKVDDKVYSANQLSLCDSFANWIQASYLPRGAWGDVRKAASEKLGLYNQHTAGKPQRYGAYSKTYTELKYNSDHKLDLYSNSHTWWGVFANNIPGDWPVKDICTSTQYYFIIPKAATEIEDEAVKKLLDISNYPNIKPYTSYWVKNMGFGGGVEHVLLSKNNKPPFVKITRGEFLDALEKAIPAFYEKEKKKIYEAEQGNPQRMALPVKELDEKTARYKAGLKNNKEKYKERLQELAMTSIQPAINDLDNGKDIFTSQYLADPETNAVRHQVYKVDPVMAELCKKDTPQWILISWDYYINDPAEKQQHEAIVSNFNFGYVYNFFFDPEKVKGQSYKPLHSPMMR